MDNNRASQVKEIAGEYLRGFEKLFSDRDLDAVERIVWRLRMSRDSDAMVYVEGNGGSAATASH